MRLQGWLVLGVWLIAAAAFAATYHAGAPIALSVKASSFSVLPGATVRLSIAATDIDLEVGADGMARRTVQDPVTLSVSSSGGTLQRTSATDNPLDLTWTSPLQAGRYAIFITAKDSGTFGVDAPARSLVEITAQMTSSQTVPPAVRVGVTPQTINLDRRNAATVTVTVLGKDVANKTVSLFSTGGTLGAAAVTTDAAGVATTNLAVRPVDVGTLTVAASYGNTTSTTTVQVVTNTPTYDQGPPIVLPPPGTSQIPIGIEPATLPADGKSTAVVSVRLTDLRGIGIAGKAVTFRTTMGNINPLGVTDLLGWARVQLVAPQTPGTGMIIAETGALKGYATVAFTPVTNQTNDTGPRIFLTIDPTTVIADGASSAKIQALVLDGAGRALVNTPVLFSATLGSVKTGTVNTGPDGKAETTLTAPDRPGVAVVTAQVGQVTAASQFTFQGQNTGSGALDIRAWSGQLTGFVADNWMLRQLQVTSEAKSSALQTLIILDGDGKTLKELTLSKDAVLLTDQYGVVRGYASEEDKQSVVTLLNRTGGAIRTVTVPLPLGTHVVDARYAEPGGHIVVTLANPDGTRPEVHFYSPMGPELLSLRDGLEKLPLFDLSGEGYLALSFVGGSLRLYSPTGTLVSEARRNDGLPATAIAVGPGGSWVAVASSLAGQKDVKPRVTVFPRAGTQATATFTDVDAVRLAAAGPNAVLAATAEQSAYCNIVTRRVEWSVSGGFERFLALPKYGVIAGQRDAKTKALQSRVVVVRLDDGKVITAQDFNDFRGVQGVLTPDEKGQVGVLTGAYVLRFPLPAEK
jgi:hypothetical protein